MDISPCVTTFELLIPDMEKDESSLILMTVLLQDNFLFRA